MGDQPEAQQNFSVGEFEEQQRIGMAIEACRRGAAWLEKEYGENANGVTAGMAETVVEMQKRIAKVQMERGVPNGELISRQMDVIYSNPEAVSILVSNAIFFGLGLIVPEVPAGGQKKQKRH